MAMFGWTFWPFLHRNPVFSCAVPSNLGRDMGGCKTYGGRKTYQRTRSPEHFGTPPKELREIYCTGKTGQWHLRGVENVPYDGGGPKPLFGRGVIREVFHPLFFPPPMASSDKLFRIFRANVRLNFRHSKFEKGFPRDPAVLKILRRSKFARRSKVAIA